jgi:hypothetical protein
MKISKGFCLKNIAGENIVVPVGSKNVSFNGMITLNHSSAFLWQQLETEKTERELLSAMLEEYEVAEATAFEDLKRFISTLKDAQILE